MLGWLDTNVHVFLDFPFHPFYPPYFGGTTIFLNKLCFLWSIVRQMRKQKGYHFSLDTINNATLPWDLASSEPLSVHSLTSLPYIKIESKSICRPMNYIVWMKFRLWIAMKWVWTDVVRIFNIEKKLWFWLLLLSFYFFGFDRTFDVVLKMIFGFVDLYVSRRFPKTFGALVWYLRSRLGLVFIKHN
jgi:hypothetical protein